MVLWTTLLIAVWVTPQHASAKALKRMKDAELIEVMLHDDKAERQREAAQMLRTHQSEEAVPAFQQVCMDGVSNELCGIAVGALGEIPGNESIAELHQIFETDSVDDSNRAKALRALLKRDPRNLFASVPKTLASYRHLDPSFARRLLDAMLLLDIQSQIDMAVFIARDESADRELRLKALETAEGFQHPRMYDAYLALIDDKDAMVRIKCATGLGKPDLPASRVAAALTNLVHTDKNPSVRAAALNSLRYYAHPELLPLVQLEVGYETNSAAWRSALNLLIPMANENSVGCITALMERDKVLFVQTQVELMQVLVRIGDRSAIPAIEALGKRTTKEKVAAEAHKAVRLLRGPQEDRLAAMATYELNHGIQFWNPDIPDIEIPDLGVKLDKQQMLVRTR